MQGHEHSGKAALGKVRQHHAAHPFVRQQAASHRDKLSKCTHRLPRRCCCRRLGSSWGCCRGRCTATAQHLVAQVHSRPHGCHIWDGRLGALGLCCCRSWCCSRGLCHRRCCSRLGGSRGRRECEACCCAGARSCYAAATQASTCCCKAKGGSTPCATCCSSRSWGEGEPSTSRRLGASCSRSRGCSGCASCCRHLGGRPCHRHEAGTWPCPCPCLRGAGGLCPREEVHLGPPSLGQCCTKGSAIGGPSGRGRGGWGPAGDAGHTHPPVNIGCL